MAVRKCVFNSVSECSIAWGLRELELNIVVLLYFFYIICVTCYLSSDERGT